jgi:ABC-2 type transport system ATP-binding protein
MTPLRGDDDALVLRGVSRRFADGAGLEPTDFAVRRGEVHALVGLNGAGKSTLMRLALGMIRPDSGEVVVLGAPAGAEAGMWSRVGHLVDGPLTYPELTVSQCLLSGAELHGLRGAAAQDAAARALADLRIEQYAERRCRTLSLGNAQRVGLAVALLHDPDLIVLDEPTNALDPSGVLLLRERILQRAGEGAGVLVSSHHLDEVARVADRVTLLNRGRIIGTLDPAAEDMERVFFDRLLDDDRLRGAA